MKKLKFPLSPSQSECAAKTLYVGLLGTFSALEAYVAAVTQDPIMAGKAAAFLYATAESANMLKGNEEMLYKKAFKKVKQKIKRR